MGEQCKIDIILLTVSIVPLKLSMDLRLTLEAFIYNEKLASWEPLIEPLEDTRIGGYRPYQVHAKVSYL